jgi:glycosyltransferase involved in cell wall biosynthesis
MKIGIVTDRIMPFYIGGYERRYWEIARRLARNHEVHVFTSCSNDVIISNVMFHKIVPLFNYFDMHGFRVIKEDLIFTALLHKMVKQKCHVIDCNSTPFIHIPYVKLITTLKKTKMVLTVHEAPKNVLKNYFSAKHQGKYAPHILSSLATNFIGFTSSLPNIVVAVSNVTKQALERNYGIHNVIVIPNGVDIDFFKPIAQNSLCNSENNIAFIGRLVPEKRVDDIIRMSAILIHEYGLKINVHILGDGALKAELTERSRKLNTSTNISFHGYVSERKKAEILKSSKIFVLPSAREGFSIAALEAMASGLPVVAAKPKYPEAWGVSEIVHNGTNGLTYNEGDVKSFSQAIYVLLTNEKLRRRLGSESLKVSEKYDWDKITETYGCLLKRICE